MAVCSREGSAAAAEAAAKAEAGPEQADSLQASTSTEGREMSTIARTQSADGRRSFDSLASGRSAALPLLPQPYWSSPASHSVQQEAARSAAKAQGQGGSDRQPVKNLLPPSLPQLRSMRVRRTGRRAALRALAGKQRARQPTSAAASSAHCPLCSAARIVFPRRGVRTRQLLSQTKLAPCPAHLRRPPLWRVLLRPPLKCLSLLSTPQVGPTACCATSTTQNGLPPANSCALILLMGEQMWPSLPAWHHLGYASVRRAAA